MIRVTLLTLSVITLTSCAALNEHATYEYPPNMEEVTTDSVPDSTQVGELLE